MKDGGAFRVRLLGKTKPMSSHEAYDLFTRFWWLIFPVMWMISGIIRAAMRYSYDQQRLDLYKSYLRQGKDVPDSVRRDL